MGYHKTEIPRGEYGEISKIVEEALEAKDASDQGVRIMTLLELSDLLLAVQGYLEKHEPAFTINDLLVMAERTADSFESGERKTKS